MSRGSLVAVNRDEGSVELTYQAGGQVADRLRELVDLENDCCGAAGVVFEISVAEDEVTVCVRETGKPSTPSRTVLSVFGGMEVLNKNSDT